MPPELHTSRIQWRHSEVFHEATRGPRMRGGAQRSLTITTTGMSTYLFVEGVSSWYADSWYVARTRIAQVSNINLNLGYKIAQFR